MEHANLYSSIFMIKNHILPISIVFVTILNIEIVFLYDY